MTSLPDLEARVAALEASRADYQAVLSAVNALGANQHALTLRIDSFATKTHMDDMRHAVLSAVNALGTNQREHALHTDALTTRVDTLTDQMDTFSIQLSEVKDLLVRSLNSRGERH